MKLRPKHKYGSLVWDIETRGFLRETQHVHCLVIHEVETGQRWVFRQNKRMNNIEQGVKMLMEAALLIGHNIMAFDIPYIQKCYPYFEVTGKVRDTLVMSSVVFANIKEKDFGLWRAGRLPGQFIGAQGLEAWGYRLGLQKGTYSDDCKAKGIDPWERWNQDMEDYCQLDVDVNLLLWTRIVAENFPESSIIFEHEIADLMILQEQVGIHFDRESAEELSDEIEKESEELAAKAVQHYGRWYKPAKKKVVRPLWNDPEGVNEKKVYEACDKEWGESTSRGIWARFQFPKKTLKFKNKPWVVEGAPFCPIKYTEFNPTSRPQIIDRFTTVYGWAPTDFTDAGNPEVSDAILRNLVGHIPMAEELAEIFYLNKRLGQIKTGAQAWLNHVTDAGLIHGRVNTGGTVSGRCSHSFPNLGQVPRVVVKKIEGIKKIAWGREGRHGADCRDLFYVPEHWGYMLGCDLSGIELRCFANATFEFDNGLIADFILNGDIHQSNYEAGIKYIRDRDQAKTVIYALLYGGGDEKLGSIVRPLASPEEQMAIGRELRAILLANMPGLKKLTKKVQKESKRGFLIGLDGRKLYVRGKHSALNLLFQHHGAAIAKLWVILVYEFLTEEMGLKHGWDGDFCLQLFVHDEIQLAIRHGIDPEPIKAGLMRCAAEAGKRFDFNVPVAAEAKMGGSWLDTH